MRKNLVSNKGFGKNNKSALMSTTAMIFAGAMLISSGAQAEPANSWNYNTVLGGNVSKDVSAPGITDITVTGGNGYVSGNASIYENHTVTVTGNSGSTFAYKDNRNNISSVLDGTLNSNMRIVIIDKDGLFFTGDSVVDVQGLVATTGDVGVADIMDGNTTLDITNIRNKSIINNGLIEADDVLFAGGKIINNGDIVAANIGGRILLTTADQVTIDTATGDAQIDTKSTGYIINTGSVTAEDAGLVALVSPFVTNDGVISAKAGSAVIAAADTVTLDMYGDGLVELAVDGELADALIKNKDTISAEGGVVNITAKAAKFVVEDLINNKGVITASSATIGAGGEIILDGGSEGTIRNSGEISTTSGGSISISGERFVMESVPVPDQKPSFKPSSEQRIALDVPPAVDPIVKSGGGNINIATSASVEIYDGVIDAQGGNLNIDNEGVFYSEDANTLKTAGTGTIELNQNQIVIPPVVQFFLNIFDVTIPQASLQNAIDAVDNTGTGRNTINASAGTFEAVTVDHANMTLNGANAGIDATGERGAETVINPNSPGITVVADNAVIDGFSVSGSAEPGILVDNADNVSVLNNIVGGGTTTHGIMLDTSHGATVSGNDVQDVANAGIYAYKSNNAVISDNNVKNAETGVRMYQGRSNLISGNTIDSIFGATRLGDGVHVDSSRDVVVSGNTISNISDDGVYFGYTQGTVTASGNTITNIGSTTPDFGNGIEFFGVNSAGKAFDNVINGTEDVGIWVKTPSASAGPFDIDNNTISNTGTDGIRVDKKGRSITGNTVTDATEHGINVTLSNNVNIAGNEVNSVGFEGIILTESTGAQIDENDIDGTGLNGIKTLNTAGVSIGDNEITNTTLNGILVTTSADAVVEDNTITNASQHGIMLDTSHGATVSGNDVQDVANAGIYAYKSNNAVISDNNVKNAETGVRMYQGRSNLISGNTIDSIFGATRLGDGVHVDSSRDVVVSGNTISNISDDGVYFGYTQGTVTASGNTITNIGSTTPDFGNGIEFFGVNSAGKAFDNVINGAEDVGIWVKTPSASAGPFDIDNNTISNTGTDGIRVDKKGRSVTGNTVSLTGEHGINVTLSNGVNIAGNTVSATGLDGIILTESSAAYIKGNNVSDTTLNGIETLNTLGVEIADNTVSDTGVDGVKVMSSTNANIHNNDVSDTVGHGIFVESSNNSFVNYNTLSSIGQSGIWMNKDNNATILGNDIDDVNVNGIYVVRSNDVRVGGLGLGEGNTISNAHTGIRLFVGLRGKVIGNDISAISHADRFADGIHVDGTYDTQVSYNTIDNVSDDGIYFGYTRGTVIASGNTITNVGWGTPDVGNGIEFFGLYGAARAFDNVIDGTQDVGILTKQTAAVAGPFDIDNNTISNTGTDGIRVDKFGRSITGNTITDAAEHGIQISASNNVNVSANDVTGSGRNGLYVSGLNNGTVTLTSNVFTDNGSNAYAQARFESGNIDLSDVLNSNVFVKTTLDTGTAMQFDDMNGFASGKLSIVGQTLGATEFTGYTDAGNFYVRFEDGAILDQFTFEPIVIDAQNASFDGIVPATFGGVLPAPTLNFLEERLFDADDAIFNGRGQIFVGEEEVAPLTFGITNFQNFFQSRDFTDPASNGASLRITGLPATGGTPPQTPADLAGIEPAAGGEEGTVGDLANLEPAAGGEPDAQVTCVGDVYSSLGNGPVTYNFGGSLTDSIIGASDCQAN